MSGPSLTPAEPGVNHVFNVAAVAVGLLAVGGGSVLAVAVASRSLDATAFATFAIWMTLANLLGLVFSVVELYLPRLLIGLPGAGAQAPLVRTTTRAVSCSVAVLWVLLLVTSWWTVDRLLAGSPQLLALAALYALALAFQSLQRGVAVGRGRFAVFTVQMGADGAMRAAASVLLAVSGHASPEAFALVQCAAAGAGVVAGTVLERNWSGWRGPCGSVAGGPVLLLLVAVTGPLVVNNAGVPWLAAAGAPSLAVGAVAGALTLSRVPTLLVGAAYGPVLAPLARAAEQGDWAAYRRVHRRALAGAVVFAVVFAAAYAAVGSALLELYLGPGYVLPARDLVAFAGGSGLMFVSVVEQAALGALSAWSWTAAAWAAGLTCFVGLLLLGGGPPVRLLSFAVLLAPAVAVLVMGAGVRRAERRGLSSGAIVGSTGEGW